MDICFLYMGICMKVCSRNPFYIEYCRKYFYKFFDIKHGLKNVDVTIELRDKDEKLNIKNYCDVTRHPSTFSILYNSHEKIIYIYPIAETDAKSVMRIIREIMLYYCTKKNDCILLHGACVASRKKAVAILGEKYAGKTTLCLQLLKDGWGYISNDKLILQKDEDQIYCWGLPIAMGIRIGTKKMLSSYLDEFDDEGTDEKFYLYPHQIAEKYKTEIANATSLKAIILPVYKPLADAISITRISKKVLKKILQKQYLECLYAELRQTLGLEPSSNLSILNCICDMPTYEITTNENLNNKLSRAIDALLV